MTAAAIATMATVEAATITAVSCPLTCSRKRKRELYELASARAWPRPSQHHVPRLATIRARAVRPRKPCGLSALVRTPVRTPSRTQLSLSLPMA
jgi:hypothetical protein